MIHPLLRLYVCLFWLLCVTARGVTATQETHAPDASLLQAIREGKLKQVQEGLRPGMDLNAATSSRENLLEVAVYAYDGILQHASSQERERRLEIVTLLLTCGADPNTRLGATHPRSIIQSHPGMSSTMLRLLLAHGAEPNAKSSARDPSGETLLMEMAGYGFGENVQAMIDAGANVGATDSEGTTTLMYAAGWHNSDTPPTNTDAASINVLKILLREGASINARAKDGSTALMAAAGAEHGRVVQFLVQQGADTRLRNRQGHDVFLLAASLGRSDVGVQALLKKGAHIGPVEALLMREETTFLKLLRKGASLRGLGPSGENVLHLAAEQGNLRLVKLLLARGFKVNSTDLSGATPLILAVAGRAGIVYPGTMRSFIQIRQGKQRPAVVAYLLAHGANVNAKIRDGNGYITVAALAYQNGATEIRRILKQHGGREEYTKTP